MVAIPEQRTMTNEEAFALLNDWYAKQQQLAELKVTEILMRKQLAKFYFPAAVEGTNRLPLGGGFDLIVQQPINRKVDEASLDSLAQKLRKAKVKVDELFPYKPSLSVSQYRELTPEQKLLVDQCLTIEEGTPSMEIGPSKGATTEETLAAAAPPEGADEPAAPKKRAARGAGKGARKSTRK